MGVKPPKGKPGRKLTKITAEVMLRYSQGERLEVLAAETGVCVDTIRRRCRAMDDARKAWHLRSLLDKNYNCIKGPLPDLMELSRKNDAMIAARMEDMLQNPDMHFSPAVLVAFSQLNERITECELARRDIEEAAREPKQIGSNIEAEGRAVRLVEGPEQGAGRKPPHD